MDMDAPCGRCKMETKHRILSITEGVPEKLICANCNSIHKFKPERAAASNKPSDRAARHAGAAQPKPRASASSPSHFQNLMITEKAGAVAKPYGKGTAWEAGMWMDHPAFGLGRIQSKSGRKLNVLFRDGLKTMMAL
jgi:hypothetical protein